MSRSRLRTRVPACLLLALAVATGWTPSSAQAQILFATGGRTQLTIQPPAFAGLDPTPDEDVSARLLWLFAPIQTSKIVASTVAPGQSFKLFAEARDVTTGNAAPEIELIDGAPPMDFIRNITRQSLIGWSRIYYRAEAPASSGNSNLHGDDNHTVYFTWTAQ